MTAPRIIPTDRGEWALTEAGGVVTFREPDGDEDIDLDADELAVWGCRIPTPVLRAAIEMLDGEGR